MSASNQVIAETTAHLDKPLITARTPLFDAGKMANISRSVAHCLRLNVVAEGVETPEQLAFLRTEDCEQAQGYHINRPMPVAAFETWLTQYQPETAASRAPKQAGAAPCISAP